MSERTMKALLKEEAKPGYVLKDIPIPDPKLDEILFKVEKVKNPRFRLQTIKTEL